jgi:Domain of unknown function (DUF5658)
MDHAVGVVIAERRWQSDRRANPTTFWSALRVHGRRKEFRRAGEASHAYVDCPSQRAVVLLFFVLAASALDALCTLLFIQHGGQEANPFMALMLSYGQTPFVAIKMALTGIGAWLLVAHYYFPMAYRALLGLAGGYMALLLLHAAILLS